MQCRRWREYNCENMYASKDDDTNTQTDRRKKNIKHEYDPDILLCEVEHVMNKLNMGKHQEWITSRQN